MSTKVVHNLTHALWAICKGKDTAAVIGASLNIAFSAMASIDSPELREHFARSLTDMADKIKDAKLESSH